MKRIDKKATFGQQASKVTQLADALSQAISRKEFLEGDSLPSINQLSAQYGVSRDTVFKAFLDLRERGLIDSTPGKGYYVTSQVTNVLLTTPQFIAFRWVDVGNATYTVAFTKASDSDTENIVTEVLNNEVTVEEELNVLSMTISKVQLKDYLTKAGFTQTGTYDVVISITATPIDLSISTALAEEGSVKTAVIHVTRD